MAGKKPWEVHPGLTLDRLLVVADIVRRVHEGVARHIRPAEGDTLWGRWVAGTTEYSRVAYALIKAAESGEYPWLGIVDAGMQFTASVAGVPFRVYHGDVENPTRSARKQSIKEITAQLEAFDLNEITRPDAGWAWRMAVEIDPESGDALRMIFVEVSTEGAYRNDFEIPFQETVAPITSVTTDLFEGAELLPPTVGTRPAQVQQRNVEVPEPDAEGVKKG